MKRKIILFAVALIIVSASGIFLMSSRTEVRDESGSVLGRGIATAEGEWMTEGFVPFTAEISFDAGSAKRGFIVLKKDNPSGLPEFDDELRIPVTF